MAATADASSTPRAGTRTGAGPRIKAGTGAGVAGTGTGTGPGTGTGADTTSTTTPKAAAVTSSTSTATPAEKTTRASTPPVAETSSSPFNPTVPTDLVTSSSATSVSQPLSSQQASTTSPSRLSSNLALSTHPVVIASSKATPISTTSNGLSTGAIVGIAVGCAVAGLVIGTFMACLFLKRRSKSYPRAELVETRTGGKSFDSRAFTATPVEPPSAVSALDEFLLLPKPDKELAGELQSLGHLIQQHVEDHYHLLPVQKSISSLGQALTVLGLAVDKKALSGLAQLADMSAEPRTRHVALQHVISRVIFESLAFRSTSKLSMLPPTVLSLVREMPPCEKHLGNPEGQSPSVHHSYLLTD